MCLHGKFQIWNVRQVKPAAILRLKTWGEAIEDKAISREQANEHSLEKTTVLDMFMGSLACLGEKWLSCSSLNLEI